MKRIGLGVLLVAAVVAIGLYAARKPLTLRVMERVVAGNLLTSAIADLPDGLHFFVCGAGSPLPDPKRSGPCTAVVAGDQLWIVDAGSGASRMLTQLRVPQGEIDGVLLTHFHSDHIDGLGELLLQRWVNASATEPLPVHGPTGIRAITDGLRSAYIFDSQWRTDHHGEEIVPRSGAGAEGHPWRLAPNQAMRPIIRAGDLTITAVRVDHAPVHPAFGYRFDYRGRTGVISGDTKQSEAVWQAAYKVDVLIHEALAPHLVQVMTDAAEEAGRPNLVKITRDILDYHTTPVEAADIAQRAKVKHLVLHHIVPPLPIAPLEEIFVEGVDDVYEGPVTVARDGLRISLPVDSEAVEIDFLL